MITELKAAADATTLSEFITDNDETLHDYFTWSTDTEFHSNLYEIQEFITRERSALVGLPSTNTNLTFLALLLQVAERLRLIAAFKYLYQFLDANCYDVGARLRASSKYIFGVTNSAEYLNAFPTIYEELKVALENEEDEEHRAVGTIVNYYAKAVFDFGEFNEQVPLTIKQEIEDRINEDKSSFLDRPIIWDILSIPIAGRQFESGGLEIIKLLDQYLNRGEEKGVRKNGYLEEEGTDYSRLLSAASDDFTSIREVCKRQYNGCGNLYSALNRGTKILVSECELYAYIFSYGNMHFAKAMAAYQHIPTDIFENSPNIIDWGCGQGLASLVLFEFLKGKGVAYKNCQTILIEPSTIALERAALHLKKHNLDHKVVTINEDIDSLVADDFRDLKGDCHVHLFSNILDMEFFKLSKLTGLIKERFKGVNYFVVVSPYVDRYRTDRIDLFVTSFKTQAGFKKLITDVNMPKGSWVNGWARVQRIFSAEC